MWLALCFLLLGMTASTSSVLEQVRRSRGTSSTTDTFVLNSTDVIEVQLNSGSSSLKFQVCHKPHCKGLMVLWFSSSGSDATATRHKKGFCYFQYEFLSTNMKLIEGCTDGEISATKFNLHRGTTNNPCGINISDDRHLKVQLDSLVEGCEVRVKNGKIWTETADKSNVKLGLAVGIPIGIIVVIGVVTLLVIFVGRPWWKKRNSKKNRVTASKERVKPASSALPPPQTSPSVVIPAVALPFPTPPASSVPPVSLTRLKPSASLTPAASSVPSESTVSRKSNGPSTGTATLNRRQSRSSKQTNSNKLENGVYDIEYHPWK